MNQRTSGFLLSDAILGFQQYKTAAGLSPRTGVSYEQHLRVWLRQIGDRDISMVTTRDITAFLAWLHNGYTPQRRNGTCEPLSRKNCTGYFTYPVLATYLTRVIFSKLRISLLYKLSFF
jgi:hypothetical protein